MISSTERRTYITSSWKIFGSKRGEARWELGILHNEEFHKVHSLLSTYNKMKEVVICADF
jgi:hypothetical protein